jgi:hypothetical protein
MLAESDDFAVASRRFDRDEHPLTFADWDNESRCGNDTHMSVASVQRVWTQFQQLNIRSRDGVGFRQRLATRDGRDKHQRDDPSAKTGDAPPPREHGYCTTVAAEIVEPSG